MTAGQVVRLREAMGLRVPDFARLLGVHNTSVYHWEKGETRVTNRRVREFLEDLQAQHFGASMTREGARLAIGKRLGVTLEAAGRLLVTYGRAPGEPWRDVVGRVTDGERGAGGRRRSRATG